MKWNRQSTELPGTPSDFGDRRNSQPCSPRGNNAHNKIRRHSTPLHRPSRDANSKLNNNHSMRIIQCGRNPDKFSSSTGEPWYKYKTRPPITNEEKIKSEMCRNLQENGKCPYGDGCRFAHHEDELKQIMRHPKHKTQLCKDYHGPSGHCTFGARCSYIHEPKESKNQQLNASKDSENKQRAREGDYSDDSSVQSKSPDLNDTYRLPALLQDKNLSNDDLDIITGLLPFFLMQRLFRKRMSTGDFVSPDSSENSLKTNTFSPANVNEKKSNAGSGMVDTPRRPMNIRPGNRCAPPPDTPLHKYRGA